MAEIFSVVSLQTYVALFFFSFTLLFILFTLLISILRFRPWCNCDVCKAYLSSSWRGEFHNLCDWYTHLLQQSPTKTIHIHVLGNAITANPENVEYVLKTRFDNFPKGKPFSTILGDLLGNGIFNVDGDAWRFQRKMASLQLGSVTVRSYAFQIVSGEIQHRLLPLLTSFGNSGDVLDMQDVFRRFAFDNICKISFGLDPGCLELAMPMSAFAVAFDLASRLSAQRATSVSPVIWKLKRFFNIGSERELKRALELVNELANEVIRQRRKLGFETTHDLLSRFMASVEDDDKYLRDIVISFLLAGRDTVASGLTTFFLILSRYPNVAAAMREEIESVVSIKKNREVDADEYEELKEMHYVHAAIYESLRLFPPVQFDSKFCLDDDMLPDGTYVTKNTRVTYHPYAMGRMETIWGTDCTEFKPERWLRDGVFTPFNPFKYPVFQAGLRVCLGKELALMEMKAVIVSVLKSFDIEVLIASTQPKFVPGLTATIGGGVPAKVRVRC